jgi:hypothetical protein
MDYNTFLSFGLAIAIISLLCFLCLALVFSYSQKPWIKLLGLMKPILQFTNILKIVKSESYMIFANFCTFLHALSCLRKSLVWLALVPPGRGLKESWLMLALLYFFLWRKILHRQRLDDLFFTYVKILS